MILKEADTQEKRLQEIRSLFDISPAHFSDRSARWLFKEKENIRGLLEIVANELVEYLDFSRLKELNRSYIFDTLKELESDMVFSVPFNSDVGTEDELLIYILIEHQSSVDPMMGFRVLFYMCQIWDGQRRELEASDVPKSKWRLRPILPIVYYTGDQRWQTPISLTTVMDAPPLFDQFVPRFDTLFLGVKDADASELTKSGNPFGWLLKVLQQEDADVATICDSLTEALSHIDGLDSVSVSHHRNVILYLYQLIFFRRSDKERNDLLTLVDAHTQDKEILNMVMTGAEMLIEQGIKKGIEQGIEQGEIQAKQDTVIKLLQYMFDEVPDAIVNQLRQIKELSQLDTLFHQALNATSLDDIDLPISIDT